MSQSNAEDNDNTSETQMDNSFNLSGLFASSTPIPLRKRKTNLGQSISSKKLKLSSENEGNALEDKENFEIHDEPVKLCFKTKPEEVINMYDDDDFNLSEDEVIEETSFEKTLSELNVTKSIVEETILLIEQNKQTVDKDDMTNALKVERNNFLESSLSTLIIKKNELENQLNNSERTYVDGTIIDLSLSDDENDDLDETVINVQESLSKTFVETPNDRSLKENSKKLDDSNDNTLTENSEIFKLDSKGGTLKENSVIYKLENVDYSPLKSIIEDGINIDFQECSSKNEIAREKDISNLLESNSGILINISTKNDFQKSFNNELQMSASNLKPTIIDDNLNNSSNFANINQICEANNTINDITVENIYLENNKPASFSYNRTSIVELTTESDNEIENSDNNIPVQEKHVQQSEIECEIAVTDNESDILKSDTKLIDFDSVNQNVEVGESEHAVDKNVSIDTAKENKYIDRSLRELNVDLVHSHLQYVLQKIENIRDNTEIKKKQVNSDILNKIDILTRRIDNFHNESVENGVNKDIESKYQDMKRMIQSCHEIVNSFKNTSDDVITVKKRLPFISDDPKENEDNIDPQWDILKKLETDEQRYKAVRKRWCNLTIPDPHIDLTHRCGASLHFSETKCKPFFDIIGKFRSQILNKYNRSKQKLQTDELKQQNKLRQKHVEEQNYLMITSNSVKNYRNRLEKLYGKQMEENASLKRQFSMAVFNLENEKQSLCNKLKSKMEEMKVFLTFYNGLDGQTALKLSETRMNNIIENHQMILNYDKIYAPENVNNGFEERKEQLESLNIRFTPEEGGSSSKQFQMQSNIEMGDGYDTQSHIVNDQMYNNFHVQNQFHSNYFDYRQNNYYQHFNYSRENQNYDYRFQNHYTNNQMMHFQPRNNYYFENRFYNPQNRNREGGRHLPDNNESFHEDVFF